MSTTHEFYVAMWPGQSDGFMGGPVFMSREAADHFTAKSQKEHKQQPRIELHTIQGTYTPPSPVYSAHKYLRGADEFDFVGVFADFESGERAAGESSQVLRY